MGRFAGLKPLVFLMVPSLRYFSKKAYRCLSEKLIWNKSLFRVVLGRGFDSSWQSCFSLRRRFRRRWRTTRWRDWEPGLRRSCWRAQQKIWTRQLKIATARPSFARLPRRFCSYSLIRWNTLWFRDSFILLSRRARWFRRCFTVWIRFLLQLSFHSRQNLHFIFRERASLKASINSL